MKTKSKTLNKEFDFQGIHVALLVDDNLWQHDKWLVIINNQTFDYHTGLGHRTEKSRYHKKEFARLMNMNPNKDKENLIKYGSKIEAVSKPKPLNIDDVLYSLIIDGDADEYGFNEWCDNFGYDIDSIKAMNIYNSCIDNAKKVKTFISNIDEARELFQDY